MLFGILPRYKEWKKYNLTYNYQEPTEQKPQVELGEKEKFKEEKNESSEEEEFKII